MERRRRSVSCCGAKAGRARIALRFRSCGPWLEAPATATLGTDSVDRRCAAPRGIACEAGRVRRRHYRMEHGYAGGTAGAAGHHGGGAVPRYRRRPQAAPGRDRASGCGCRSRSTRPSRSPCMCARMRRHPRSPTCTSRRACPTGTTTPARPVTATVRRCTTCLAGTRCRATTSWSCRRRSSRRRASTSASCSRRCGLGCRARPRASRHRCTNLTRDGVRADVGAAVVGAGRVEQVQASGSARRDLPLEVPAWARGIQVDVQMPRTEWARFTDLGLTLFDCRRAPAGQGAAQLFVRPSGARTGERARGAAGDGVALPRLCAAGRRGTVDDEPSPSACMPTRRRRWRRPTSGPSPSDRARRARCDSPRRRACVHSHGLRAARAPAGAHR